MATLGQKRQKAPERREAILVAAIEEFAQFGYHGGSTERIALPDEAAVRAHLEDFNERVLADRRRPHGGTHSPPIDSRSHTCTACLPFTGRPVAQRGAGGARR